jgi:anti-sigma regulatory factor (Ser/Thr protein kinase)
MKGFKGEGRKGPDSAASFPGNHGIFMLGHELGNVLHGMLGITELLRDTGLSREQERWLKAIEHCGRQMHHLIESVASRHGETEPGIRPRPVPVDGVKLLEQAVIKHYSTARARHNQLYLLLDTDLPRCWKLDPRLLHQLLDNLMGNAVKFTQAGEIVLTATIAGQKYAPDSLLLRVTDTGPGVSAAVAQEIFEAYRKGEETIGAGSHSMGLGLFICQRIVRAMNASLDLREPDGGGACFEVLFPGVLQESSRKTWPRLLLLSRIHCQLDLEGTLRKSVEYFLSRLGVSCAGETRSDTEDSGDRLQIIISPAEATEKDAAPALKLESLDGVPGPHVLASPVLLSGLAPQLLDMALQWLSSRDKPGSAPARYRPEQRGDRDSHPA